MTVDDKNQGRERIFMDIKKFFHALLFVKIIHGVTKYITKVTAVSKYRLRRRRGRLYTSEGQLFFNVNCYFNFFFLSFIHYLPKTFVIWEENPPLDYRSSFYLSSDFLF